jgi:hypothetical protein
VCSLELWTTKRHNIHGQDIETPPQSLSLAAVRANNLINSTHRPQRLSFTSRAVACLIAVLAAVVTFAYPYLSPPPPSFDATRSFTTTTAIPLALPTLPEPVVTPAAERLT